MSVIQLVIAFKLLIFIDVGSYKNDFSNRYYFSTEWANEMAILLPFPRLNLPTLLKVSYQNLSPNLFRFLMIMFVFTELAVKKTGAPKVNFSENICSEDEISCLPASPRIFEHLQNGIIAHF